MDEINQDPRQKTDQRHAPDIEEADERSENIRIQDELDTGIDSELERERMEELEQDEEDLPEPESSQEVLPTEEDEIPLFDPSRLREVGTGWREEGEAILDPEQYDSTEEFVEDVLADVIGYYPGVGVGLHGEHDIETGENVTLRYELTGAVPLLEVDTLADNMEDLRSEQLTTALAGSETVGLRVDIDEQEDGYRVAAEFVYDSDQLEEGTYGVAERLEELERQLGLTKFP